MEHAIEAAVDVALLRTLRADPEIDLSEAARSVVERTPLLATPPGPEQSTNELAARARAELCRRTIPNPRWLESRFNLNFNFFLVNAQPGWLSGLTRQIGHLRGSVSHYVLYGVWDSLLVLCGTDDEARGFRQVIESSTFYDTTNFKASETLLYHRTLPADEPSDDGVIAAIDLNQLIDDYDTEGLADVRDEGVRAGILLGPTWTTRSGEHPGPAAYVGIKILGGAGQDLKSPEVVEVLLRDSSLRASLTHLWQVDRGVPFNYFARLECQDLFELDRATDGIALARAGRVRFEPNTLLVASGQHALPKVRTDGSLRLRQAVYTQSIQTLATDVVSGLGEESIAAFNEASPTVQLIILRSVSELKDLEESHPWSPATAQSIRASTDGFAREALRGSALAGPVLEVITAVERVTKQTMQSAIDQVYGRDKARSQQDLSLGKPVRKAALGQVIRAIEAARQLPQFAFLNSALTDGWLERLSAFTDRHRNLWAHADLNATLSGERTIDEARRSIAESIALLRWLEGDVQAVLLSRQVEAAATMDLRVDESPVPERLFGVFVSYSHRDRAQAQRISEALRALGHPVWYDNWAIGPSESILDKVSDALARNDTILVLLSPSSVRSLWVQRELNSVLTRQLAGHQIAVVPILIEECEIPLSIRDIKYIDMRESFEEGFLELLEFLRGRKTASRVR